MLHTDVTISKMVVEYTELLAEPTAGNINERAKYTANTGTASISIANTRLDGGGTTAQVIRAASNGTLIKNMVIKAITPTTEGMVRLFVYDGTVTNLIDEFQIPPTKKSGTYASYMAAYDVNYNLQSGDALLASTQNAEGFIVIAEGLDWAY